MYMKVSVCVYVTVALFFCVCACVYVQVRKRMKLEGKELDEYLEKEKTKKEAAKKLEQAKE